MTTIDTNVKELIINELTKAQYDAAVQAGLINENELYMVTDESYPTMDDLANVATTGDYNDLVNKPTIPEAQVQSDWNATTGMGVILNKPTLANVATSGDYNDLINKPTIPEIDEETITLNDDDELQVEGIINQNDANGSINPLKLWEGTEQQWSNGVSTTWYNWEGTSAPEITETEISFTPQGIAYGNGKCIAVGKNGKIYSSIDDGTTWVEETSGTENNLLGIAYGNNTFIAVGNSGTVLISSGNGNWTSTTIGGGYSSLSSIVFGKGIFVTRGYYSADNGQTWNSCNASYYIVFANNRFYSSSSGTRPQEDVMFGTSDDGINWTWNSTGNRAGDTSCACELVGTHNAVFFSYQYGLGQYWEYDCYGEDTDNTGYRLTALAYDNAKGKYYIINNNHLYISNNARPQTDLGTVTNIKMITCGNQLVGAGVNTNTGNMVVLTLDASTSVYTTDLNPTTESNVYSNPNISSALTITSVGTGTITCSDTNTYTYNSYGTQITYQSVGEVHPDWLCNIEGVGVKKGSTLIAEKNQSLPTWSYDSTTETLTIS